MTPISKTGLEAAFVAFGVAGTDVENKALLLKLMRAIEAYLLALNYDNAPTDPHHGGKIWKE